MIDHMLDQCTFTKEGWSDSPPLARMEEYLLECMNKWFDVVEHIFSLMSKDQILDVPEESY